nr:peptidoglycan DD-metalloendopeptidase family protein [Vibrio crassostreae]
MEPQVETKSYVVGSGDSLIYLLKDAGLSSAEVKGIVYNSRAPKSAFNLMKGDGVEVTFDKVGSFKKLSILPKGSTFYEITNVDGNYSHKKEIYPEELRELKKSFVISDSVYKDGLATGLTAAEVARVINVFQHKVDTSKVSKGEEFDVLLHRVFANGKFTGSSVVKAVRYTKRGVSKYAFLWSKGDKEGYFDENGDGLMPSFMRHPIKNPRITSNYNPKRLHPILKIVRPHRGTDYGGNRKPIMAIADGKVVHAGRKGSFGNTVIIKHANGVQTLSAHMSKIMSGVKRGATVTKGQTVGLIGSTGVSTGPHLHFEMKIDGRYVNPLKAKLPMDDKVDDISEYKSSISKVMKTEGWD